MAVNVRFQLGTNIVDLESYQWGFVSKVSYLERDYGTSGYGVWFREKLGVGRRILVITFKKTDELMDTFRTLAVEAMKTGETVQFFGDLADVGSVIPLDWPQTFVRERVIENRQVVELECVESVNE